MLKVLLKKQLTEIFQSFFVNRKKGTARSRVFTAGLIVLYVLLMGGVIGECLPCLRLRSAIPFLRWDLAGCIS